MLSNDVESLKNTINPFTGCFVSKIPITVCMMRYALRASDFFNNNDDETGKQFMNANTHRLKTAIDFIVGENSLLRKQIAHEKLAWDCFYDTLDTLERGIAEKNANAEKAKKRVQAIVQNCKVNDV